MTGVALAGVESRARPALPVGDQRLADYAQIETFRVSLSDAKLEDRGLDELKGLVRLWASLLADEGCFNPGGIDHKPKFILWKLDALKGKPEQEQGRLLLAWAKELDDCTRVWHADGTLGNTSAIAWDDVVGWSGVSSKDTAIEFRLTTRRGVSFPLVFEFFKQGVLRIRGERKGYFEDSPFESGQMTVCNHTETLEVACGEVRVAFCQAPFRYAVKTRGQTLRDCRKLQVLSRDGKTIGAFRSACALSDRDHFLGLGERFNALDQRGRIVAIWGSAATHSTLDQYWSEAYKPMPLYYNPAGYGCFWNTLQRGRFDFGVTCAEEFRFEVFGDVFDHYLFVTDSPEEYLQKYTALTGKPILPPEWVFTPWLGGGGQRWALNGNENRAATAMDVVRKMKALDIPHGAIFLEGIDPLKQNKAPELMALLKRENIKGLGWTGPMADKELAGKLFDKSVGSRTGVTQTLNAERRTSNAEVLDRPEDLFLKTPEGKTFKIPEGLFLAGKPMVDFTHSEADRLIEETWRDKVRAGYSGLMLDGADEVFEDLKFHTNEMGKSLHNYYAGLYHATYARVFEKWLPNDHALFGRAACPGDQKYVMHFAGDHDESFLGLRGAMIGGLNAAFCGLSFWGSDIGGYCAFWRTGPLQKTTYIRWLQFGCFSPLMRFHGTSPREPWRFDEETIAIYKKYAWVRMALQPYIQALARNSHETGMPLLRSLSFVYPADQHTYGIENQFFFGPALLVNPLTEAGLERRVYFPPGEWVSLFGLSERVRGPVTKTVSAGLSDIPVYVKAGSVVPVQGKGRLGEPFGADALSRLLIVPGKTAEPVTLRLRSGGQCTVSFAKGKIALTAEAMRNYNEVQICLERPPKAVTRNGKAVAAATDRARAERTGDAWFFDDGQGVLVIPGLLDGTNTVTVVTEGEEGENAQRSTLV